MLVAQDLAMRGADDISINKPIALQHFANTLDRLTPKIFSEHRDLLLLLFKNNKDAFLVLEHDANQIVFLVQRIAGIEICDIEQRRSLVVPTSTAGLKITIELKEKKLTFSRPLLLISYGEINNLEREILSFKEGYAETIDYNYYLGIVPRRSLNTIALSELLKSWCSPFYCDIDLIKLPFYIHSEAEHLSDLSTSFSQAIQRLPNREKIQELFQIMCTNRLNIEKHRNRGLCSIAIGLGNSMLSDRVDNAFSVTFFFLSVAMFMGCLFKVNHQHSLSKRITKKSFAPLHNT